jgi:NADPH:quinone reductase-like Zn-dependent oxidoreductase
MKAIIIEQYGGPEKLAIQNLPDPEPKPGHVVIAVKAFGINHAETHMRKGEWAEAAKVSGITGRGRGRWSDLTVPGYPHPFRIPRERRRP